MWNSRWLQLPKRQDLLIFFVVYEGKLRVFFITIFTFLSSEQFIPVS